VAHAKLFDYDDYIHNTKEEAAVIEVVCIITEAETAAAWTREEADAVRQICALEAS
jgi:hypothetical protein